MLQSWLVQTLLAVSILTIIGDQLYMEIYQHRHRKNTPREDRAKQKKPSGHTRLASRMGISVGHLFAIYLILNILFYDYLGMYVPRLNLPVISDYTQFSGFLLTLIGCVIIFIGYRSLGLSWINSEDNWSSQNVRIDQPLVKSGIYKHIRNPIYLGGYFFLGGTALLTLDMLLVVLVILTSVGLYSMILDEEAALREQFREEYDEYVLTTGRLLPRIKI